jgi:phosphopentomutase
MSRALLIVADSLGIGAAPDAERFGDAGADTFGHILKARAPRLPHLRAMGLHAAHARARGRVVGEDERPDPGACWAVLQETSTGKDTTSGHWELCGTPVDFDWLLHGSREASAGLAGRAVHARRPAGRWANAAPRHRDHRTPGRGARRQQADRLPRPIGRSPCTNGTSLERCSRPAASRELVDEYRTGDRAVRRGCRQLPPHRPSPDYAVPTDPARRAGGGRARVLAIGKVADFAGRGITRAIPASGLGALLDATEATFAGAGDGSLVFVNLVDFDSEYGHRATASYAADWS